MEKPDRSEYEHWKLVYLLVVVNTILVIFLIWLFSHFFTP